MKKPVIETNVALEFLYTLMGMAYYDNSGKDDSSDLHRLSHFVSDFIKEQYPLVPIMIRNDIHLFLKDWSGFFVTMLHVIVTEDLKDVPSLLTYFHSLTTHELLDLYLLSNDSDLNTGSSTKDLDLALDELSVDLHKNGMDKAIFYEFLNYPSSIVSRLHQAFEFFYLHHFKPIEDKLKIQLDDLVQRHRSLFDDNPDAFMNAILLRSKESIKSKDTGIYLCPSVFHGDWIHVFFYDDNLTYFLYGSEVEKILYSKDHHLQYEELLKSLADDTRRHLIRFLMNEPHYNKEISDHLGITTATISYHISKLTDLGIITLKYQEGKRIYYQVDHERFDGLFDGLKHYLSTRP